MVERVYEAVAALGQGRAKEIRETARVSEPSARQSLEVLRQQERVRIVAQDSKMGITYGLMPGVADAA